MAKEIEINLAEENDVSIEVKDTGNVEIGVESDAGGTTDYSKLKNKPSINGVTLEGNKTSADLGIENYDDTEIKGNISEIEGNITEIEGNITIINNSISNVEKENTYQNKRLEYLEKNQIQAEVNGEDTLTVIDGAFAYANILKETEIEVEGVKKKAYIVSLPQGVSRQETEPTIDNLAEIENVKGDINIEVENVDSTLTQAYTLHLGDLELNGIGDLRDNFVVELDNSNLYKKVNKLYLKKKLYKYIFTGNETFYVPLTPVDKGIKCYRINLPKAFDKNYSYAFSNVCKFLTNSEEWLSYSNKTDIAVLSTPDGQVYCFYWKVSEKVIPNINALQTYFQNNEVSIVYKLKTPELIDLTETYPELVQDIENLINNIQTYEEVTHINTSIGYLELSYIKKLKDINKFINDSEYIELYYKEKIVRGEYIDANNGNVVKATTVSRTDYMPVNNFYKIICNFSAKVHHVAFFDKDKNFVSGIRYENGGNVEFCIPDNISLCSIALYNEEIETFSVKAYFNKNSSINEKYKLLKMNCLGDSITFGYIPDSDGLQMEKPYPRILKELLNLCDCRNYGISGSKLCTSDGTNGSAPMSVRYTSMENDANIISVFGGTNDYNGATYAPKLGTINDTQNTTVYGALNTLCSGLIEKYPKAFIFFITPLRRADRLGNNNNGYSLADVAKAINEVCYKYSIPVLDLYSKGGFHVDNATFRGIYSGNDKLHPNQLFITEHLAPMIEKFIRSNF